MKIVNADLLNEFRGPGLCEYCRKPCRVREAAHIEARGMSAGKQLDIRENLVALGGPFDCGCHHRQHYTNRNPSREDLLRVVARRMGIAPEEVQERIWQALRAPKPISPE